MSEYNFDQHMNQVLKNLEVPFEPGTWTLLEQRLDAIVAEEHPAPVEAIDKLVYHTLERLEAPYQSAHWEMMAQRLQQHNTRMRRLRMAKFAEAAIFLLLLINLDFFRGHYFAPGKTTPTGVMDAETPVARANTVRSRNRTGAADGTDAAAPAGYVRHPALAQTLQSAGTMDILSSVDPLRSGNVSAVINDLNDIAGNANKRIYASADLLPYNAFGMLNVPMRSNELPPAAPVRKFHTGGPVYFASFASADQNQVLVDGARRAGNGYGAGIAVGVRRNKWGVETGITYGHYSYAPHKQIELYQGNLTQGYYGSTLTGVQTDMVSVPVKVSRQLARVGNTTARAVAGVTANVAVQKSYDYGTITFNDPNPPSGQANQPKPVLRKSGRGLLEKGGLKGNTYVTLDAGIRIEHPIGRGRYTAFIEPAFRQSLSRKGVGPNREPVNTMTLQAGVMAFL